MIVVVDTSIVVKWFVTEDDSHLAIDLLRRWDVQAIRPVVPTLAVAEIGNVLLKYVLDGLTSTHDAELMLSELPRFVSIVGTELRHTKRALGIAEHFGRRALYDIHFLVLAEDLGCELWTADERFWQTVSGSFPFVRWLGNVRTVAEPEPQ
jgi:predicted nucleic acid-binding protein